MLFSLLLLALAQLPPKLEGPAVPVLCYHNITIAGGHASSLLFISDEEIKHQMQTLQDSGFHSILPEELRAHLVSGKPLPSKPVMITFDDSHKEHYSVAAPVLERFGYRGTFFVMTVTIGKKGYLSVGDIRALNEKGHAIGCHTWDHPHLSGEEGFADASRQLSNARATLEKITGSPVRSFAFPFGAWNEAAVRQLKECGFDIAFQLSGRDMSVFPAYTVRRIMVNGGWDGNRLLREIHAAFQTEP